MRLTSIALTGAVLAASVWWSSAAQADARVLAFSQQCDDSTFAQGEVGVGTVNVADGAVLYLADSVCPQGSVACRLGTIRKHSKVLTSHADGAYTCVYDPKLDADGYVRSDDIRTDVVDAAVRGADWYGHWKNGDDTVNIKIEGDMLDAMGHAFYPERNPPRSQFPGGPNLGAFSGHAKPSGRSVTFHDGACSVHAILVAKNYLLISDNNRCGGMNVTFSGMYTK